MVVIGGTPPQAGDLLVALAVGGRWVAESRAGASSPVLSCSPCNIPKKNLTLSWTNSLIGAGSTPLVYVPPGQWNSACTNQLLFSLACPGSWITLSVTYFLSGYCPTGQSQSCVSPGYDPFTLSLDSIHVQPVLPSLHGDRHGLPGALEQRIHVAFDHGVRARGRTASLAGRRGDCL